MHVERLRGQGLLGGGLVVHAKLSVLTDFHFGFIFLIGACSIFVTYALFKSIMIPITKFRAGTESIGKGNLDQRIDVKTRDEFGHLADSFNSMTVALKQSYSGLEQKVKERTARLEEAKAKDEAMLANIGDGLVFTDLEKRVVLVNKAAENMLGFKEQELLGKFWVTIFMTISSGTSSPRSM